MSIQKQLERANALAIEVQMLSGYLEDALHNHILKPNPGAEYCGQRVRAETAEQAEWAISQIHGQAIKLAVQILDIIDDLAEAEDLALQGRPTEAA